LYRKLNIPALITHSMQLPLTVLVVLISIQITGTCSQCEHFVTNLVLRKVTAGP